MNIRKWLIKKIAGDRLVLMNATILYKYYPLLASEKKKEKPILESNIVMQSDAYTPFMLFSSSIFEIENDELKIKDEYLPIYTDIVNKIKLEETTSNDS